MSIEIIDITPVVTVVEVPFTIQSGGVAPTNVTTPSIGADDPPRVDDTLGAWPGVWDQVVSAYTYQWYRDGSPISGATSQTYDLVDADEGAEITVGVVASNGEGSSAEAVSVSVGPVDEAIEPLAAFALTAPAFGAGVYQVGETTPYTPGTYAGSGTVTVTRTLEFLSTGLWSPFPGLPTGAGIGAGTIEWGSLADFPEALRIKEVATNGIGFGVTQYSDPTVTVYAAGALPLNVTAPDTLITGVEVGDTVSTTGGEDDGQGAPITGYEYRYLRDGTPISGATSLTYTLVSADLGTTITPQRKAVTSVGSASAWASADAIDIPGAGVTAGPLRLSTLGAPDATSDPNGVLSSGNALAGTLTASGGPDADPFAGAWAFWDITRDLVGVTWSDAVTLAALSLEQDIAEYDFGGNTSFGLLVGICWGSGSAPSTAADIAAAFMVGSREAGLFVLTPDGSLTGDGSAGGVEDRDKIVATSVLEYSSSDAVRANLRFTQIYAINPSGEWNGDGFMQEGNTGPLTQSGRVARLCACVYRLTSNSSATTFIQDGLVSPLLRTDLSP